MVIDNKDHTPSREEVLAARMDAEAWSFPVSEQVAAEIPIKVGLITGSISPDGVAKQIKTVRGVAEGSRAAIQAGKRALAVFGQVENQVAHRPPAGGVKQGA